MALNVRVWCVHSLQSHTTWTVSWRWATLMCQYYQPPLMESHHIKAYRRLPDCLQKPKNVLADQSCVGTLHAQNVQRWESPINYANSCSSCLWPTVPWYWGYTNVWQCLLKNREWSCHLSRPVHDFECRPNILQFGIQRNRSTLYEITLPE